MHRNTSAALVSIMAAIVLCAPAHAQTMYRCGKTYQDRPCDNGQQGKVIGSTEAPRATSKSVVDASCAKRGEDAQKVVWSREAGALQDKLMAEARSGEQRKLIADVYAMRGTSSTVRAAIETDCALEKERSAQAAAMMGGVLAGPANDARRTGGDVSAEPDRNAAGAARAERAAAERKRVCDGFNARLAAYRDGQRAGGSISTMERLKSQRRDTESEMTRAGCDGGQRSMQMQ